MLPPLMRPLRRYYLLYAMPVDIAVTILSFGCHSATAPPQRYARMLPLILMPRRHYAMLRRRMLMLTLTLCGMLC